MSAIDGCAKLHGCTRPVSFDRCIECVMERLDTIRARRAAGNHALDVSMNTEWKELSKSIGEHIELTTDQ